MTSDRWDALSAWLTAWMAADADGRERLRSQLAAEDPDLATEADALAASSRHVPGFLETPALVLAAREVAEEEALLPAGSMVGPYRIVGLLARGGMGDVYRATDVRLRRDVALKVLSETKTGDPQRVERFMQEARVTAALDHPNVVRVFDVGWFGDRAYLVAELLDGETLRARIARGPMLADEARRVGLEIARGLEAAHAAGLVHRDLKPENVFLVRSGTTKLLDFGIAKLAQDESVRDGFSTLTGVVLGTAGYLSPEQIRGEAVDARADLFALGAVLFEMLTGTRAFAHEHIVETLHAILHDSPPDALATRVDLPDRFTDVVMRLLEKSPEDRCSSSAQVIAALESIDTTMPGRDVTGSDVAQPLSSSVVAERTAVTLAVMPFRSIPAGSGADLLELGLADVFISRLSQVPEIRVLPLTATERVRSEDPRRAAHRLGANRVLMVTLQRDGGFVRASVQLLSAVDGRMIWATTVDTDASSVFSIQDIIVTRVLEELAPRLVPGERRRLAQAGTRSNVAYERYLRGRLHVGKPTPTDLHSAAGLFQEAVELDPGFVDAWAGLGSAYKRMPIVAVVDPVDAFPKAKAAALRALELDHDHAEAHSVLGTVAFWYDWDYPAAERHLRRALAIQPSSADSQVFLAHLFSNVGRHDEALNEIRRARALDPGWPLPRSLEGQFLFMARRYDDAIAHLDAMLEVTPGFWTAHLFRAYPLCAVGRHEEAMRACERAAEIHRSLDGRGRSHPLIVAVKGYALAGLGWREEALAIAQELQAERRDRYVPPVTEALALHAVGKDAEALARLQEAVRGRDVHVTFLGVDPKWDALRGSPAFRQVLSQVNLVEVSDRTGR